MNLDQNLTIVRLCFPEVLEIKNASFRYSAATKDALTCVSTKLNLKSRVAITGPNGAGKTTLMNMLCGEVTRVASFMQCVSRCHIYN